MLIWGTESIKFNGKPLDKKDFARSITDKFTFITDLLNPETGLPWDENDQLTSTLSRREVSDWQKIITSVTTFLTAWYHICNAYRPLSPNALGGAG